MPRNVRPRLRPGADGDAAGAVDDYLAARFYIGLEDTLLQAARRTLPSQLVGVVRPTLEVSSSTVHLGGGISKVYAGTVEIVGITYETEFEVWTDVDGYGFITDIARFDPVEWRAHLSIDTTKPD